MIVDYLRSCYTAPFVLDDKLGTRITGVFFRASPRAEVYLLPTYVRASSWLDEWDRNDGPGDVFAESEWYDGHNPNLIAAITRERTAAASTGCDRSLTLVPSSGGMALGCGAIQLGIMAFGQSDGSYRVFPSLDVGLISPFLFGQRFKYVGNSRWEAVFGLTQVYFYVLTRAPNGEFLLTLTTTYESHPTEPLELVGSTSDLVINGGPVAVEMLPIAPWIQNVPPGNVIVTLQWDYSTP